MSKAPRTPQEKTMPGIQFQSIGFLALLLPLVLGTGVLATWTALDFGLVHHRHRQARDAWMLILLGWIPLLAWVVNWIWPQVL